MSPLAIARNVDRVKHLRKIELEALHEGARRQAKADADRLARQTATAVRQSDKLAENVKESLLHTLEPS